MYMSKRTRGAVSVFLVIILVPCMLVSSLFVDLGRVFLSKSMANSAGDLALNSLLTHYDSLLKDWYGMAASCQSIDKFYKESGKFFLDMMKSQDLTDAQMVTLVGEIAYGSDNKEIADLLQMECLGDASGLVSPVKGSSLADAAMMKSEIVEFMKYRAPIEMTRSLIERLTKDNSLDAANQASDNEKLDNAKTDFYNKEGELVKAAFDIYCEIWNYYQQCTMTFKLSNSELAKFTEDMTVYKNAYIEIHKLAVAYLLNTDQLKAYHRVTKKLDEYTYNAADVCTSQKTENGATVYYISNTKITELLNELSEKIDEFNTAKTNFENAAKDLMQSGNLPDSGNDVSVIQWWVQMDKAVNSPDGHTEKIENAAKALLKAYAKALAIDECTFETEGGPTGWQALYDELTEETKNIQAEYLTADVHYEKRNLYLFTVDKLEKISQNQANRNNINKDNYMIPFGEGKSVSIDYALNEIKTKLHTMQTELQSLSGFLDNVIYGVKTDAKTVKPLSELITLATEYKTLLDKWKETADSTHTDMAAEDQKEIEERNKEFSEHISAENVRELETRLTNIRSQLQTVIQGIDSMTYGEKKLSEISDFSAFKQAALTKVSKDGIPLKKSAINDYAKSTFKNLFTPNPNEGEGVLTLGHLSDTKFDITLDMPGNRVDIPGLLSWLYEKFGDPYNPEALPDAVENAEGEQDSANSNKDDKANYAQTKSGRYHGGGENIVHDGTEFPASGTFNLGSDAVASVSKLFDSLMNLDLSPIRDDLYATAYVMNMFSYATFENEGLYALVEKQEKAAELNLSNYPTYYSRDDIKGKSEKDEGTWCSTSLKDSYNKSLTNKMISLANNSAYCAEVEYILNGGSTNEENVKSVYGKIYLLRFALNTVSAFANFWNPTEGNMTSILINSIAHAVAGATAGIIPAPVTKLILIPLLAVFETANDLERLEAGFPVELYKKDVGQWWMSMEGITKMSDIAKLSSGGDAHNDGRGLFYSDYLTAFVYIGLSGDASEAIYQRIAEVMRTNIRKISGNSEYTMNNAHVYFQLNAEIRVKPLMLSLPLFNGDEYENNPAESTDWRTYKIRVVRGY